MDIAALVRAVVTAFDDAAKLVRRIQDQRQKSERGPLPEEPTRDLLESLALGPMIVRGHYDHDLKRFGEPYACGDGQAREQLKDVLITLQMNLIISLRTVYMDDIDLDFEALQAGSDDSRVNAGVCLGQLAQRLSDQAKANAHVHAQGPPSVYSSGSGLMPPKTPSLRYSSSRSTHSSTGYPGPRTPDHHFPPEQFHNLNLGHVGRPRLDRKQSNSSAGSDDRLSRYSVMPLPPTVFQPLPPPNRPLPIPNIDENEPMHQRRRSSQALAIDDDILKAFPVPGRSSAGSGTASVPSVSEQDRSSASSHRLQSPPHASPTVSPVSTRAPPPQLPPLQTRERVDSEEFGTALVEETPRQYSHGAIYDMYNPNAAGYPDSLYSSDQQSTHSGANSHTPRAAAQPAPVRHGNPEHVEYLQKHARAPTNPSGRPAPPRGDSVPGEPPKAPQANIGREIQPLQRLQADDIAAFRQWQSRPSVSAPIPVDTLNLSPTAGQSRNPSPYKGEATPAAPRPTENARPSTQPAPASRPTDARPSTQPAPAPQPPLPTALPPVPNTQTVRKPAPETYSAASGMMAAAPFLMGGGGFAMAAVPAGPVLIYPSEKNLMGFCKGAWRLQSSSNKAFVLANRPVGYASVVQYWHCGKCNFEGPATSALNVFGGGGTMTSGKKKSKKKDEIVFDPKVRVGGPIGGVRYKWAFLAKCHVPFKGTIPIEDNGEGTFGSFGCVFCAIEGKKRGWDSTGTGTAGSDRMSVKSGATGVSAKTAGGSSIWNAGDTPIFGNLESFMEHLVDVHRREDGWPCQQVRTRYKVVCGRPINDGEQWDLHIMPIAEVDS